MGKWALDLGTTNTGLARWDQASGQPQLVELPRICRKPRGENRLEAPALVTSVVDLVPPASLLDQLGTWPPLERRRRVECEGLRFAQKSSIDGVPNE